MPIKLSDLREGVPGRVIEPASHGFVVVRAASADRLAFDAFVREVIDTDTDEYVALPVTDGASGYERVVVLPLEG